MTEHDTTTPPAAHDRNAMHLLAEAISAALDEHFPVRDRQVRQVLALCEEAGELAEAHGAWVTAAAFNEPSAQLEEIWGEVETELADVAITTYVTAHVLDITLPASIEPATTSAWHLSEEGHVLALSAAIGAFVGAWRRYAGMARRQGAAQEVANRLTEVHTLLRTTAHALSVDLPDACARKAEVVFSRGWREPATDRTEAVAR